MDLEDSNKRSQMGFDIREEGYAYDDTDRMQRQQKERLEIGKGYGLSRGMLDKRSSRIYKRKCLCLHIGNDIKDYRIMCACHDVEVSKKGR